MRDAGQPEEAARSFAGAYRRLADGEAAVIRSDELEPVRDVPTLDELSDPDDPGALDAFAVIKLNGGLATTMGLQRPKSLVEARDGRSFLDIIIGQTVALRREHGIRLPLVLMDSDATRAETLAALAAHPELETDGLALDFLQSMVPKLDAESLEPVTWPRAPALEWVPPGMATCTGRCSARACSMRCSSAASATR